MHDAAFANGVLSHGLVRDDMHVGSVSHLGTVLVPTLLALAADDARERQGFPHGARRRLRGRRQSRPHDPRRRSLEDLPPDGHRRARSRRRRRRQAARLRRGADDDGARARREHGGRLQRMGRHGRQRDVLPQRLRGAQRRDGGGARGRRRVRVAHRDRRRRRHARRVSPAAAADVPELFADRPEILAVFFKPVPACNFAQTPAQAAHAIAQRERVRAADVERIVVRVTRAAALYPGCDVSGPFEHVLQAKMSIHYNVAAALATATSPRQLRAAAEREVQALATRHRRDRRRLHRAFPAKQGAEVIVHTRAGDVRAARRRRRADGRRRRARALLRGRQPRSATTAPRTRRADRHVRDSLRCERAPRPRPPTREADFAPQQMSG